MCGATGSKGDLYGLPGRGGGLREFPVAGQVVGGRAAVRARPVVGQWPWTNGISGLRIHNMRMWPCGFVSGFGCSRNRH